MPIPLPDPFVFPGNKENQTRHMLILDFDLDFIVRPIRRGTADHEARYNAGNVTFWNEQVFRLFLEERLHLSQSQKIQGIVCEHHKEVFFHTQSLIKSGRLVPPLYWVHVDAHDDISGCSDNGEVSSADFLLHLIGQNWLHHIDFVLPDGEDKPPECLIRRNPLRIEFEKHCCPITFLDEREFSLKAKPDFVFLTRSPDFTPPAADFLFNLAKNYIKH